MRSAALALLLGGCLIVRTNDEIIEDPCPEGTSVLLADTSGPFVLAGDAIYFAGANGTLSRLPYGGDGTVSELTPEPIRAVHIAADATDVYWATEAAIMRKPIDGGAPFAIADGFTSVSELLVDDTSVVWASSTGLHRWRKVDETIENLDTSELILGLGVHDGVYYYSDTYGNRVRRGPPGTDLAAARFPGPLVVAEDGVYFYEAADAFVEYGGSLRLVPRDGGTVVTTADDLSIVYDLALDDTELFFATAYNREFRIKRVSRFGGTVATLACGEFREQSVFVATTPQHVYYSDGNGLFRIDKSSLGAL
jgi:hypothetical protein